MLPATTIANRADLPDLVAQCAFVTHELRNGLLIKELKYVTEGKHDIFTVN